MMKVKLERKYIYIIIICLVSIILFSLGYVYRIKKLQENNLKELNNTIMELKKYRLKEIVNRTIQEINTEQEFILQQSSESFRLLSNNMDSLQSQNIDLSDNASIKRFFSQIVTLHPEFEILVWDKSYSTLMYTSNSKINAKDFKNEKHFINHINKYKINTLKYIEKNNIIIALCLSNNYVEEKTKNSIKNRLRKTTLDDNGYIWINQVLDYNGGDGYAIRLVHPNLLETEGEKLSTNTKDLKGNLPYLTELIGIKQNGELFHDYYFKKKNSNYISHKLSYAKLYPKYNWIICSGLYLDDLELLINRKTKDFHKSVWLQINTTIIMAILCFIISGVTGFLLLNSKKLQKMALVKQKDDIVSKHYNILESKYDKTNETIHDIKNHLICINALAKDGQSQKVIEYIESINEDITQLSDIAITYNKMIDIIINDKIHLMKKYNINFKYEVQSVDLDFIQNKDICTIMSNLLDNSIESCIRSTNKNILLKLHCFNKSFIVIKFINSCDKNPIITNNRLITTKPKIDYHGYGMKNIEKSVNKYSGNMTWRYDDLNREFTTVIIFPIPYK